MDWCTILELCVIAYLLVQILRLIYTDCDLQLQWAERFGKSTGQYHLTGDLRLSGSVIRKSRFIFTKAENHKAKERMFKSFK